VYTYLYMRRCDMRNVPAGMAGTAMHYTRAHARAHKLRRGRVGCSSSRNTPRTTTRYIDTRERHGQHGAALSLRDSCAICPPFHSISLSRFPLCGRAIVGLVSRVTARSRRSPLRIIRSSSDRDHGDSVSSHAFSLR
jgi:hypothetical protein